MLSLISGNQVAAETPFNNAGNGFVATNAQAAIEEARNTATGISRFTINLINNASMSNGQRFGYSELLPNSPVIIPRTCTLKEIAFSNGSASTDAQFRIYSRTPQTSPTPSGTLLYTWNLTNTLTATLTGLTLNFTAGQEVLVNFVDTGNNPNDAVMTLFFVNS